MDSNTQNLFQLYKLDYEKAFESSDKLENTKLVYQKFFISLVSFIGTVSIAFLKIEFFNSGKGFGIDSLIGLLLIFSTILGYIIVKNLVSIRRQSVFFNNSIIFLRGHLIEQLNLGTKYPTLKEVSTNHKDSADYLTILLCSLVNLIMFICGLCLLIDYSKLQSIQVGLIFSASSLAYVLLHYFTVEKLLKKGL